MFRPDIYARDVHNIDYNNLKEKGIKLLCFDLDNTLDIPDSVTEIIREDIDELLDELENQFEVMIISNNTIKGRVASFADLRGMHYIEGAKKPFIYFYKGDEKLVSYDSKEIAFIGDKIVTDIIGAKRHKSIGILVDPLYPKKNHWYTKIMKVAETIFCTIIRFEKGNYYDKM